MNRLLTTLFMAMVMMIAGLTVTAQDAPPQSRHRGVRLTPEQQRTILAVQPWLARGAQSQMPSRTSGMATLGTPNSQKSVIKKTNPSGSKIQGWRMSQNEAVNPNGWYELGIDGSEKLLWEYFDPNWTGGELGDKPVFPFNSGFWRDDKIYGFHSEMRLYWLVWGHGTLSLTGEVSDYVTYGENLDVTDFSTYVLSCAYNSDTGKAYAYTLNADASAYMFQEVNPDTWEFTPINTNVKLEDICGGFCYNPADKKMYGITPNSRLVTLDESTGEITQVAKYNMDVTTALGGLTYSPLDKLFFFVYADGKTPTTLNTIDAETFKLEKRGELGVSTQYTILICPDKLISPLSPQTPEILSLEFAGGSSDGTAKVKIPVKAFDGSDLTGSLKLTSRVDWTPYSETTVKPGEEVEIAFKNIAEGSHRFSFIVTANDLESAPAEQHVFVGYDIPKVPQNVRLEAGSLKWDAVTEGISGGYIDSDALTYNVYLNGEKINAQPIADTSYTFGMPEETFRKYVAQVEAVNHGHTSERGFSNDIKYGNPFPLPFSIAPTQAESELVKMESSNPDSSRKWTLTGNESDLMFFACFTTTFGNLSDEWVFMPGITVPQGDNLMEISFDVRCQGYDDTNAENIAVGVGSEQNIESATIVKTFEGLQNSDWKRMTVWCKPQAGTTYVGFRTSLSEIGNTIMLRNLSVKMSDRPATTPAAVEKLVASPLPNGELKANVSFTLPTLDAAGNQLADKTLTATVKSDAASQTVTGTPGSAQTVVVATADGMNTITVTADNSATGLEALTSVYTGIDVPQPLGAINVSNTEDYKSLHLEWETPTQGANGGYVDPAKVRYALCLFNYETFEWELSKDLGTVTSFDYTPASAGNGISVAECGILTFNDKGNTGKIRTVSAPAGKPFVLPMAEIFGETECEPKISSRPDESYVNDWSFIQGAYPYWVSQPTPYGNDAYICSGWTGEKGRVILPAFSTEGLNGAGIEMPLWRGPDAGEIQVYAQAYGVEPELIGSFRDPSEEGWTKRRFHLPAKFLNRKWVNLIIDAVFDADGQTAGFGQFKIKTFVSDDIAVNTLFVPAFPMVGVPVAVTAEIENSGLQAAEAPQMELTVSRDGKNLAVLAMERVDGTGMLSELDAATYRASWTPNADNEGNISFSARTVNPDMDPSNDSRQAKAAVGRGNTAVVTDLKAEENTAGVTLTWTDPTVETGHEDFESMAPFSYGEQIGDFTFYCLDGEDTMYFGDFRFPYDSDKKAWQVISQEACTEIMEKAGFENNCLTAATGDQALAAFTPLTFFIGDYLQADRWLVSPELKPGSKFSFMMTPGMTGKIEKVEVLVSTTDNNPDSFVKLDAHQLLTAEWQKYEYTLPEDAKYFAIRYRGDTEGSFFVLVDDIKYEPAAESPVLEGFDIYRDGALVAEAAKVRGTWSEPFHPEGKPTAYNIKPVVSRKGVLTRGFMSNTATVGQTGVDEIETTPETDAEYFSLQGFRVDNPDKGIYLKRKAGKTTKVLLK